MKGKAPHRRAEPLQSAGVSSAAGGSALLFILLTTAPQWPSPGTPASKLAAPWKGAVSPAHVPQFASKTQNEPGSPAPPSLGKKCFLFSL